MERMHEPVEEMLLGDRELSRSAGLRSVCATRVARVLQERGLHAALAFLNERTRYRFTGLYQADPPVLRNVGLFDRENPRIDVSGAVTKLDETYCAITASTAAPFSVQDARSDQRLVTHAARDSVLCYAGVPIRLGNGRAWGSLCHFDMRPRLLVREELDILASVAEVMPEWLASRPVLEGD